MSNILFGLVLISASLQTAWALFAEEQLLALSAVVVLMLYVGWKYIRAGSERLQNRQGGFS
jgi:membrane protein implicated in regulation of membrane protease activity